MGLSFLLIGWSALVIIHDLDLRRAELNRGVEVA
jgi:hypothetical protein